jgi:hypothetical protein
MEFHELRLVPSGRTVLERSAGNVRRQRPPNQVRLLPASRHDGGRFGEGGWLYRRQHHFRQAGSRAAKTTAVMNLLALAKAANGGDDGTVSPAEARRILSRLARGSDPNVRIKALESLSKLERDERTAAPHEEATPEQMARRLVELVPMIMELVDSETAEAASVSVDSVEATNPA